VVFSSYTHKDDRRTIMLTMYLLLLNERLQYYHGDICDAFFFVLAPNNVVEKPPVVVRAAKITIICLAILGTANNPARTEHGGLVRRDFGPLLRVLSCAVRARETIGTSKYTRSSSS